MLLVNLLHGVFLASIVCFIVGGIWLTIQAGRYSAGEKPTLLPNASQTAKYQARVRAAFDDPRFRIGRTLIVAGGIVAVVSFVVVFVLSVSLPRCAAAPGSPGEAVAMCMPAPKAPAA